jgi:hypothetical protein
MMEKVAKFVPPEMQFSKNANRGWPCRTAPQGHNLSMLILDGDVKLA